MDLKNNGKRPDRECPIYTLNVKGKLLSLDRPRVMGILNVTDDSFYAESRVGSPQTLIDRAGGMLEEGATFLDIGGQSTRPGSTTVGPPEETDRVIPVIETLLRHFPDALLSIDTYHSAVARAAVGAGVALVNDISSGSLDKEMIPTVAALHVPYIAMHMQGTPSTMQQDPHYADVTREVLLYLAEVGKTCTDAGIHDVIVDPGFGFGKTFAHNFRLLNQLELFALLSKPVLVGFSRKSTIYKTLKTTPEKALNGTTVLNTVALMKGAHILRVHDVLEAMEAIQLVGALG
jgi:dihydropteroate synthase